MEALPSNARDLSMDSCHIGVGRESKIYWNGKELLALKMWVPQLKEGGGGAAITVRMALNRTFAR